MKRRDNKKNLRNMKKNHGVLSFILFMICLMLFIGALALVLDSFLSSILSNKVEDEYERVKKNAEIYENNAADSSLRAYLNMEDQIWIVRGSDGSIIEQNGENSCGTNKQTILTSGGFFLMMTSGNEISGYEDTKENVLYGNEGVININLGRLRDLFNMSVTVNTEAETKADEVNMEVDELKLPYWISVSLKDGSEFVGKAFITIGKKDLLILAAMVLILVLLVVFIVILLITNLVRSIARNRRMTRIFYTDEVTRGKNRMWFLIKGEQFLKKGGNAGHSFAIVSLSMIRYSNFCMCHSIAEGEKLLTAVMNLLNRRINKKEMAVHYGNAEFALILFAENMDQLQGRIMGLLGQTGRADAAHRSVFHAGVAILPPNIVNGKIRRRKYLDLESIYNNACAARVTLDEKEDSAVAFFDTKLLEEQRWIEAVQERQAQALANEEFVVYYQPKYSPDTEELKGAEALIRWQSPEFGFIPPGRFIPIFEKNGFITEIDHYMIRHVAADQRAWLDAGKNCVPVSVNVSRAHFIEPDLAEQIRDMVDEAGAPRELIEIELTESAFFDDKVALISTLNTLKSYGFTVSMDDFGSGYSSLNSLKDMALDVLKLDADFFRSVSWPAVEEKKEEPAAPDVGYVQTETVENMPPIVNAEAMVPDADTALMNMPVEVPVTEGAEAAAAEAPVTEESAAVHAAEEAETPEEAEAEAEAAAGDRAEAESINRASEEPVIEKKELPVVVKKEEKAEPLADERARIVVTEAIRLARRLNMRTVAEGVEEKDQVDFLAEQGCDMIQGFYFAKPMPKNEYEQRLK